MPVDKQPGDVILHLRPSASPVPVGRRVARLLKFALRGLSLRCVNAAEVPADQAEVQAAATATTPPEK